VARGGDRDRDRDRDRVDAGRRQLLDDLAIVP
jgi:hypothetical protein